MKNETKNVTSGTFTDNTVFQIQNIGPANIQFFIASTANSKAASSGLTVLSGTEITVAVSDLGGITAGTFVNVSNNDSRTNVVGSYVFKINGNKQTVSYDTYTQTFYNLDTMVNPMLIPSQEYLFLTPTERKDHHKEYLTNDNQYFHEINHVFNTEYLSWMTLPVKTIIGINGAKSYDGNDNIVADQPATQITLGIPKES
jgi:hypothetical protein